MFIFACVKIIGEAYFMSQKKIYLVLGENAMQSTSGERVLMDLIDRLNRLLT